MRQLGFDPLVTLKAIGGLPTLMPALETRQATTFGKILFALVGYMKKTHRTILILDPALMGLLLIYFPLDK